MTNYIMGLDLVLLGLLALTALILNPLPQSLQTGRWSPIFVVALFAAFILLIVVFRGFGPALSNLRTSDVILLVLMPLIALSLKSVRQNPLPQLIKIVLAFVGIYLVLFALVRPGLGFEMRFSEIVNESAKYRLVIYSLLLISMMLTRPQGLLGGREFGFNWLKRAQKRPEGDEPIGATQGVPIAERNGPTADHGKEVENR